MENLFVSIRKSKH